MNYQKGFAPIVLLFIIIGVIAVGSGVYYYQPETPQNKEGITPRAETSTQETKSAEESESQESVGAAEDSSAMKKNEQEVTTTKTPEKKTDQKQSQQKSTPPPQSPPPSPRVAAPPIITPPTQQLPHRPATVPPPPIANPPPPAQLKSRDITPPIVRIVSPATLGSYITINQFITVVISVTDDIRVVAVNWRNVETGITDTAVAGSGSEWTVPNIRLQAGVNTLIFSALDEVENAGSETLYVRFDPPPPTQPSPPPSQPQQQVIMTLSSLSNQLPQKYHLLLSNSKINSSILIAGSLQENLANFLRDRILDLESKTIAENKVGVWNSFGSAAYNSEKIKKAWLQQIALSLYVEANKLVPWSILSYNDSEFNLLFTYSDFRYPFTGRQFYDFNHNPLTAFSYGQSLQTTFPNVFGSPRTLLESLIKSMRNEKWIHVEGAPYDYYNANCTLSDHVEDIECLLLTKKGTSTHTPLVIKAVLASYNIPSQLVRPFFGHGGIFFPTMSLALDGDAVYNGFLSGLRITPNKIPVENSLLDLDLVRSWMAMGICIGERQETRSTALSYLQLVNRPEWREDLIASYKTTWGGVSHGEWLKDNIINGLRPNQCTEPNPGAAVWQQPLTNEELDFWIGKIAEVAG
jgi:hypothetical protein